jgi:four helix bundle protein
MAIRSYRDLNVWQAGIDLVDAIYRMAATLPVHERFGLVQQMRRSATSIPSNIAEGQGREHLGDYLRHLSYASGSLKELETLILIAGRLGYLADTDRRRAMTMTTELGRMLSGLVRSLKRHRQPNT